LSWLLLLLLLLGFGSPLQNSCLLPWRCFTCDGEGGGIEESEGDICW